MSDPIDDSTERLTVTRTYYQQLAEEIMADLDRVAAKFPQLEDRHRATANDMRAHMNVPRPFLGTAVVVAEEMPELLATGKLVPDEARDTLQYLDAFRLVDDKLDAVKADLRHTMMSRRTTLALKALQIFALARSFARTGGMAITAHVENLRRDLGKRGRPRKK